MQLELQLWFSDRNQAESQLLELELEQAVRLLFVVMLAQVFAQDGSAFQQLKEQELEYLWVVLRAIPSLGCRC